MPVIQPCTACSEMHSDLNGNKIETGEPILKFHDSFLKLEESRKAKRLLRENYKRNIHRRKKLNKKEECLRCFESKRDVKRILELKICQDCASDLIEEIEEQKRKLRKITLYWNPNGINIRRNDIYEKYYYDDIDGKKIKDDILITLAGNDNTFFTRLSNIRRLIEELKNTNNLLENAPHMKIREKYCSSCDSKKKLKLMGELALCSDCREKRRNLLQKYLRNNKEEILANEI